MKMTWQQLVAIEPRLANLEQQIARSHPPAGVHFHRFFREWMRNAKKLVGRKAERAELRNDGAYRVVENHLFVVYDSAADDRESEGVA